MLQHASAAELASADRSFEDTTPPTPILRLFTTTFVGQADELPLGERVPVALLSFDYGGTLIRAGDSSSRILRQGARGLEAVPRDEDAERRACRLVERLGAVDLGCIDTFVAQDDADFVIAPFGTSSERCAFTSRVFEDLVALGFVVQVDRDYPYQVTRLDDATWDISILRDEKLPDWFSVELGISYDGRRVDLLPLLLDLVDGATDEDDLRAVERNICGSYALRISDTHSIAFPASRFRSLLRVLVELYQGVNGKRTAIQFSETRAPAVERLITNVKGAGSSVVVKGLVPKVQRLPISATQASVRPLQAELRSYQRAGVEFLSQARSAGTGCVLADDMGLGKTLQTIAHLNQLTPEAPAIIVAPTSLAFNWAREIDRFAPHLRVVVVTGPRRHGVYGQIPDADIVITTFPVIVRDADRFADLTFSTLVVDEAQAIKNTHSQTHLALGALKADHRICLTGTPIENNLGELWSLFHFLNPVLLGDELTFRERFRIPIETRGDELRLEALREIVKPYILRRRKSDVVPELPPKTELYRPVELEGLQRELYEQIRVAAHSEVRRAIRKKGLAASTISILDAITKLRQVCCDPRLVSLDEARRVQNSAKASAFFELLAEELAEKRRVLVFSQFTSMLALLSQGLTERGIGHTILTGQTKDRASVVDRFETAETNVFLISLKAGGTGLNLTSADTVIHYDPWWNPASQVQATARAHRIGQKKPVFVHHLFVAGSVEERVLMLQKRKGALSAAIFGEANQIHARMPATSFGDVPSEHGGLSELDVERLLAPLDR